MDVVFEQVSTGGLDQKDVDNVLKNVDKAKAGTWVVARGTRKEMTALKAALREKGHGQGRRDIVLSNVSGNGVDDEFELKLTVRDDGRNGEQSDDAGVPAEPF
jgi:hypothetical protein